MRYLSLLLILGLSLTSCGEDTAAAEKAAMDAARAAQETAYDAMMEGHDRVMPLMGKITAAQRSIKEALNADELEDSKKDILEAANEQLEDANDGMMEWMQGLKPLDELRESMDNKGIVAYIREEAGNIAKVESSMNAALGAAANLVDDHGHSHEGGDHSGHKHELVYWTDGLLGYRLWMLIAFVQEACLIK
jgi:hypothetical protein